MNIIVVGCGRVGAELAYRLFQQGHQVTVIDYLSTAFANLPPDFRGRTIQGEALNQQVLHRAGIEKADGLAMVTSSDTVNAVVAHAAKMVYGISNIIVRNYDPRWRSLWDWCIFTGSLVAPLLLGVAFANIARGVPIDANMQYTGGFFNLLNPYALLVGITVVLTFILHGAIFLTIKVGGGLVQKAQSVAQRLWPVVIVMLVLVVVSTLFATDLVEQKGVFAAAIPVLFLIAPLLAGYYLRRERSIPAFVCTTLSIAGASITFFLIVFPRVMLSSTNPDWSLTIYNASSSPYTLTVMSIVAAIFVPIVIAYQAWSYWIFRHRVGDKPEKLTY